jgi:hypothetical protein
VNLVGTCLLSHGRAIDVDFEVPLPPIPEGMTGQGGPGIIRLDVPPMPDAGANAGIPDAGVSGD